VGALTAFTGFLRLWLWFIFRPFRANLRRSLTVLLGVALGAAGFSGVRLAVDASMNSFATGMDHFAGKAEAVVLSPGAKVPDALVAEILKLPETAAAAPVLDTVIRLQGSREPLRLIGIAPMLDREFRDFPAAEGEAGELWSQLMTRPWSMALSSRAAETLGVAAGESVQVVHSGGPRSMYISAVLEAEGLALVDGGMVAVADIAVVQELSDVKGLHRIDVRFHEGVSPERGRAAIDQILPPGVRTASPSDAAESGRGMISAYEQNLTVLSFVSLFVGMFLIYGLTSLNAASRRYETAVLRALGAGSRTVFFFFLTEGGLLGVLGWCLSIPIAALLVGELAQGVGGTINTLFVRVSVEGAALNPWEVLASLLVTVGVALAGALQPAMEAMGVPPREALHMSSERSGPKPSTRKPALLGFALILLCRPISLLPGFDGFPLPGYMAIFALFSGFALLSPFLLRVIGKYVTPLVAKVGGLPALMAGRSMRDSGMRTAVSVGALITASALFVALVVMIHSFRGTFAVWLDQTVGGDLFLRPVNAEFNEYRDAMPPEFLSLLGEKAPQATLLEYKRFYLSQEGKPFQLEALDIDVFRQAGEFLYMEGDPVEAEAALREGRGVIASEVYVNTLGLGLGETFRAEIGDASLSLPIVAVIRSYRTRGGVVYTSLDDLIRRSKDESIGGVRVFFSGADARQEAESLRTWILSESGFGDRLEATVGDDLRKQILRIFDETFAVTSVLLVIALVVAGLGIAATLTVLVLERRREINTMAALGASRAQLSAMIVWESLHLVFAGLTAGPVCGFLLSGLLIYVVNKQSFGWTFLYSVDWLKVVAGMPAIGLTALAAALPAVRTALKSRPADVLRER
jgi:putative ABC transport system permease protein